MIYKDLFKIIIDNEKYTEDTGFVPKYLFTLEEMKNIYLENLGRKFEIEYEPFMVDELLSDEERYDDGEGEIENEY